MNQQAQTLKKFDLGAPRLLTVEEVARILSIGKSTVWERSSNDPLFPRPFKLSAKQTRWSSSDLGEYVEAQMQNIYSLH
jgi:predicted DNA-binding transcriptional regulator AlpA